MPLPRVLARANRVVTNRIATPVAWYLPGTGVVEHRGRRSGRQYRTPVLLFTDGARFRVALTYGTGTDWVRNVRAAGGAAVLTRGRRVPVSDPRIGDDPRAGWAPWPVAAVLRLIDASSYLDCTARRTGAGSPIT
ncbi:deazaflavin-dependent oxidoreductase (nitroreductase family) [Rhodococcus sp. SMB37]|uniref:nitroreductase family deazaflavin-dependent oxidoreductase n=1 Tax=Rhodococcus sp. SMB37 TaxID=2512213 RepID=UPI001045ECE6|nr:nitroreductase family deazaflavin-dependent oxidoreductase [Rhodococcus sp. SMB37]TCN50376.1 deazaflavin-dependent oxidoreductase (nitroreductase family) [Rhodococcus sp. SMB37]